MNEYTKCERYRRFLAGSDEESVRVDYSVLSVGVMTLGLIMIVEVIRHKLDHIAGPRPFSKAVLQGVYSELATLGIVELLLFMLSKYYNDLDKEKYLVFADIHFALFYTAILNAFQSVILAIVSHRVARRIWVETEMLELSHYVEIREEFERVKIDVERIGAKSDSGSLTGRRVFHSFMDRFRYPTLRRKYNELLLQVRFHELRVHFLQAYDLPLTLKVSDYLLESQQQVLLKLVHVSSIAWTLLTGAVNVMYYVLGIVSYKVSDSTIVGKALIWIFFCSMAVFVIIAAAVNRKMESIFKEIMIEKTLWGVKTANRDQLREQQLKLFYGGDPKLVIAAIQFMQFGYAVSLAVVIIFWQEIDDGKIPMVTYLLVLAVCYTVFVHVTARVIPQYTMCTNLGQLVDEKTLHATLAAFVLEESRRQEADEKLAKKFPQSFLVPGDNARDHSSNQLNSPDEKPQTAVSANKPSLMSPRHDSNLTSHHGVTNAVLMAELVKLDTDFLRMNLPSEERSKITFRQMERTTRRGRQKSLSEGIASMVAMGNTPFPNLSLKSEQVKDDSFLFESKEWTRPSYRFDASETLKPEDTSRDSLARRRRSHRRLKTVSDGVAAMARIQTPPSTDGLSPLPENHNESSPSGESRAFLDDAKHSLKAFANGAIEGVRVRHSTETDQLSVHSDGGHSDIDDVPDVEPKNGHSSLPIPVITLRKRFKKFTLSKKYIVLSNVFGTLVAFFLVGQRVEGFLHSEGIVSEKFVSFDFNNEHTFWALFVLFSLFCLVDCAIMMVLNPVAARHQSTGEMKAFLAALLDLLLMSTCLILMIVAEVKRCCTENESDEIPSESVGGNPNSSRLLAAQSENASKIEDYYNNAAPCSCPQFGHRAYGGLGTIEPFTSFVALRIFRHWAAGHIMKHFLFFQHGKSKDDAPIQGISSDPFAVFDDSTGNKNFFSLSSHDGPREDIRGTAAELWKAAIGENPEVAKKYGEFSCEVLKIMLGMSVSESGDSSTKDSRMLPDDKSSSLCLRNKNVGLAREAKQEALDGSFSRTFKQTSAFESTHGSTPDDEESFQPQNIDRDTSKGNLSSEIVFRSPGAQLVRSMRRCDRKLLPILNTWTAVDVVLTRFEIVYFEIMDADETAAGNDAVKKALKATKGGKGLRLCDVAQGRRIIGRLEISDIESVTVQRYTGIIDTSDGDRNEVETEIQTVEFWKDSPFSGVRFSRSFRWSQIKQDQVHVKTIHGRTLCLRFYSDLEAAEQGAQHPIDGATIQKNNAFQWVQTIGRVCGPDQLKQHLPHFGDATDDELRDYLFEHKNPKEETEKLGPRRINSTGDLLGLLGRKTESSTSPLKKSFRGSFSRFPSFAEQDQTKHKDGDSFAHTQPGRDTPVDLDSVHDSGDVENATEADL